MMTFGKLKNDLVKYIKTKDQKFDEVDKRLLKGVFKNKHKKKKITSETKKIKIINLINRDKEQMKKQKTKNESERSLL